MFILLLLPWVVSATTFCSTGDCWTGLDGCLTSQPGTPCVACEGNGYIDTNGDCVFEIISFENTPQEIRSTCPTPTDCRFLGSCLPSVEGVRCEECNGNGHLQYDFDLNTTTCICATEQFNAEDACSEIFSANFQILNQSATLSNINCNAHQQPELGFFRQPPIGESPTQCWSEVYGPAPGVLSDDDPRQPLFTCNTYCGTNPNKPSGCETCAGNGFWDSLSYSCICDEGFTASVVGTDFSGNPARVCDQCWGFRGQEVDGGYCDAIFTPEPITGVFSECGGHGVFDRFECLCHANMTAGFWAPAAVTGQFKRIEGNGTEYIETQQVMSCVECQTGFALPDCLTEDPTFTSSPTLLPTSQLPTDAPTRSPISSCDICNSEVFEEQTFFADAFSVNYSTVAVPPCSNRTFGFGPSFVNSSLADQSTNLLDATRICQFTPLCQSWTFSTIENSTFFYFFVSTGENSYPIPGNSPNSTAGVVCEVLN